MKSNITKYLLTAALAGSLLASCGTDFGSDVDDFEASAGDADFSTFVTVGDSLTAGFADNALYRHGQENSYPAILAQQFALVGGGAFTQPLMPVGATGSLSITGIGTIPGISDRLLLVPSGNPERPATPGTIAPVQTTSIDVRVGAGGFNNLGVPGAKSFHLGAAGYGTLSAAAIGAGAANPFFSRFSSADGTTVLADAIVQAPTFFILWIGNNDVLSYATDGGATGVDQTGNADPTTYGSTDITDPGFFAGAMGYPALVAGLTAGGAKGVLVNIPDVSTIPFFTFVQFNAIPMDQPTATAANAGFALYNIGVQSRVGLTPGPPPGGVCGITQAEADRRQISFVAGQNPVVILDENLSDLTPCLGMAAVQMRQATASDFVLLSAGMKLGTDAGGGAIWGVSAPLLDGDVLIDTEVAAVDTARMAYNATIQATANGSADLVLLDAAALLKQLNETGISYGSGGISSTFGQGGGFSLDGVHPTARGYAVIANEIIKVINAGFNANLPPVDPGQYTTVFYQ